MRFSAFFALIAALALSGCVSTTPNDLANIQREERLMASVYSLARPAEHVAQDEAYMPLETMLFAGVAEGQRILELSPDDGYYTRLLAQAVGQSGRVYVVAEEGNAASLTMLQSLAEQYGNIELVSGVSSISMIDMVWAIEAGENLDMATVSNALGPGGSLYVETTSLGNLVERASANDLSLGGRQDRTDPPVAGLRFSRR